jgi:hypothetical protein
MTSKSTCANSPDCAPTEALEAAEIPNSGGPAYEHSLVPTPLAPSEEGAPAATAAPFIIGFDAEWVEEPAEPQSEDDQPADPLPHNRVLSYQYACRHAGEEWSGIIYTRPAERILHPELSDEELAEVPERIDFEVLLAAAIREGVAQGRVRKWPKHVIATAHWTRADLSAMANHAEIKGQFDGVQKTYVTLSRRFEARVTVGKRVRTFSVTLVDTNLLVPGTSKSLTSLGDLYGLPKLDVGKAADGTKYISSMDRLLQDNPELYEAYAIRDAEISALHVHRLGEFVRNELGLERLPVTLGGVSAEVLVNYWRDHGFSEEQINGYVKVKETHFNRTYTTPKSKRYLTKPGRRYNANYEIHRELAERCFHGGRNECYAYGPTSDMSPRSGAVYAENETDGPVLWREFDLKGAYATSLSALRIPDYDAAFDTKDPAAFRSDTLGFARVRFSFPEDCRFPCLPVEAEHDRGLIYPRSGEAYVTGPEIELARHLGAELEILNGVVVPWLPGSPHPFQEVIKDLRRRRGEHEKGTLQNELFKQLGNGIYGKLGQGIKGNTAYNTRTDNHEEIGESKITNPYLAAYVTGLIRALLGELIAAAGLLWTVISATTDSLITNCQFSLIQLGGPIARYMIWVAEGLEGKPDLGPGRGILEQKAEASRLLPWRTRGIATLTLAAEDKPKLARAGMRSPPDFRGDAENAWFVRAMADRFPGMKYESSEPLSFPYAHRMSADHVYQTYEKSCNFEFDFKRKPVTPVPKFFLLPQLSQDDDQRIVQHLSFNTVPWQSIEEFNETRALFEAFRTKHRGS